MSEETTEENTELTLREQLEADLKGYENDEEEPTENTEDENVEEEESDGGDSDTESSEDAGEQQDEDAGEDSEDEGEEEVTLEAPEHWAAEDRETFGNQPEEVKSYLLKRHNEMESGFTKKTQELAEQRKATDALSEFMGKWEPHTAALGVPLVTGLEALLNHDRQLRSGTAEQRRQVLLQLAQQYGIDINSTTPVEDEYADPQLKQLQDQINTLNGNETARKQADEQAVTQRQQSIHNEAQTASDTFKSEKDEKGNLKYPHFDTLKSDMGALIQSGQAGTGSFQEQLEGAYSKALWMNTDTREQLLASKQSSLKEESIKKQSKAAAQAKKSAKANKKGTSAKAEKPKKLPSLRDDLADQIKQAEAAA